MSPKPSPAASAPPACRPTDALTALTAGIITGLLGTGGGILLLSVLRRGHRAQDAFAATLACILPLSALSAFLYLQNGAVTAAQVLSRDTLPCLIGAIPGGVLGASLLDRLTLSAVRYLFAGLLLFSGWRMAFA